MDAYEDALNAFDDTINILTRDPHRVPTTMNGEEVFILLNHGDYSDALSRALSRLRRAIEHMGYDGFSLPSTYVWRRFTESMDDRCYFRIADSGFDFDAEQQKEHHRVMTAARADFVKLHDEQNPEKLDAAFLKHFEADEEEERPVAAPLKAKKSPKEVEQADVFISHASEDKEAFVRDFANSIQSAGISVWYDEFSLKWGMSLRKSIDKGLSQCKRAIVVLSPDFFNKNWSQMELDALVGRVGDGEEELILPILHNITIKEVRKHSPMLAGVLAKHSTDKIDELIHALQESLGLETTPTSKSPMFIEPRMVKSSSEPEGCYYEADPDSMHRIPLANDPSGIVAAFFCPFPFRVAGLRDNHIEEAKANNGKLLMRGLDARAPSAEGWITHYQFLQVLAGSPRS